MDNIGFLDLLADLLVFTATGVRTALGRVLRGRSRKFQSVDLLESVIKLTNDDIVFPPENWAATFRSYAQLILHELGEYLGYSPLPLLERLIEDAQKTHTQRLILRDARYRYATEV
jgi:hypothetical protein